MFIRSLKTIAQDLSTTVHLRFLWCWFCHLLHITITWCNFHPFTFYLPFHTSPRVDQCPIHASSTCTMGLDPCARHSLFRRTDPYYTDIFYSSCGLTCKRPAATLAFPLLCNCTVLPVFLSTGPYLDMAATPLYISLWFKYSSLDIALLVVLAWVMTKGWKPITFHSPSFNELKRLCDLYSLYFFSNWLSRK